MIARFHRADPGSIPGEGTHVCSVSSVGQSTALIKQRPWVRAPYRATAPWPNWTRRPPSKRKTQGSSPCGVKIVAHIRCVSWPNGQGARLLSGRVWVRVPVRSKHGYKHTHTHTHATVAEWLTRRPAKPVPSWARRFESCPLRRRRRHSLWIAQLVEREAVNLCLSLVRVRLWRTQRPAAA